MIDSIPELSDFDAQVSFDPTAGKFMAICAGGWRGADKNPALALRRAQLEGIRLVEKRLDFRKGVAAHWRRTFDSRMALERLKSKLGLRKTGKRLIFKGAGT